MYITVNVKGAAGLNLSNSDKNYDPLFLDTLISALVNDKIQIKEANQKWQLETYNTQDDLADAFTQSIPPKRLGSYFDLKSLMNHDESDENDQLKIVINLAEITEWFNRIYNKDANKDQSRLTLSETVKTIKEKRTSSTPDDAIYSLILYDLIRKGLLKIENESAICWQLSPGENAKSALDVEITTIIGTYISEQEKIKENADQFKRWFNTRYNDLSDSNIHRDALLFFLF